MKVQMAKFETELKHTKEDVAALREDTKKLTEDVKKMATKEDVEQLKEYFLQRDLAYGDRMFWIVKALVLIVGGIVLWLVGGPKLAELLELLPFT